MRSMGLIVAMFAGQVMAVPGGNVGGAAPLFTLQNQEGKTIRVSNLSGRVVLLDFWATMCGGWKQEIHWYL